MKVGAINQKYKLPMVIFGAFVLAAVWVGAGRLLFGVFGWVALVTLFGFAPLILMYGATLAGVVAIRQRSYTYHKSGPFIKWLRVTLIALFIVGLSMPDAGDTAESAGSALSVLLGNKNDAGLLAVSGIIVVFSVIATLIAAFVTFVQAFTERLIKKDSTSTDDSLKQSS